MTDGTPDEPRPHTPGFVVSRVKGMGSDLRTVVGVVGVGPAEHAVAPCEVDGQDGVHRMPSENETGYSITVSHCTHGFFRRDGTTTGRLSNARHGRRES